MSARLHPSLREGEMVHNERKSDDFTWRGIIRDTTPPAKAAWALCGANNAFHATHATSAEALLHRTCVAVRYPPSWYPSSSFALRALPSVRWPIDQH